MGGDVQRRLLGFKVKRRRTHLKNNNKKKQVSKCRDHFPGFSVVNEKSDKQMTFTLLNVDD